MGRKTIQLTSEDWKKVNFMLKGGATGKSIASNLGIGFDTLDRRIQEKHKMDFAAYKKQKRAEGLDNIKVKQYERAMAGSDTMLIWIGKNELGQSDKVHQDIDLYEPPNVRFVERQEQGQEQPSEHEGK